MSIEYTYTIIKVDESARCMEVIYEAAGHSTMHIGARLPFDGESLEDVIKMYAPVQMWIDMAATVFVPEVGTSGTVVPSATEQTASAAIPQTIPQSVL
jgi:hypothetical protein